MPNQNELKKEYLLTYKGLDGLEYEFYANKLDVIKCLESNLFVSCRKLTDSEILEITNYGV